MSNSPLVNYTKISPNSHNPRNRDVDTITIHCVVGQTSVESLGELFYSTDRQASSNYGVGFDGKIGMYVEEKNRSWCTSSSANDNRAITIEVASDNFHPYAVTDKAMAALITLVADICNRNGIEKLLWKADPALIGQVDKQNMTVHRWFAPTSCPGDYLFEKHYYIAEQVNKLLSGGEPPVEDWQIVQGKQALHDLSQAGIVSDPKLWEESLGESTPQWLFWSILERVRKASIVKQGEK